MIVRFYPTVSDHVFSGRHFLQVNRDSLEKPSPIPEFIHTNLIVLRLLHAIAIERILQDDKTIDELRRDLLGLSRLDIDKSPSGFRFCDHFF